MTDQAGTSYANMMANAGRGLAEVVKSRLSSPNQNILFLIGPGNNGGDGLVAAHSLHTAGYHVKAYLSQTRDPEVDAEYKQAVDCGVELIYANLDENGSILAQCVKTSSVIIDALLGTGSSPPLRSGIAKLLQIVQTTLTEGRRSEKHALLPDPENDLKRPLIIAVDGPSGLDFDSGEVDELTLPADITVTFAAPKWGHFKRPGANLIGELIILDIGTCQDDDIQSSFILADVNMIRALLPGRSPDAHKGTFGRVMIVAGSTNYTGAAILAVKGALRSGAGLVTLALPSVLHTAVVSAIPEATYLLLPHTMGVVNEHAISILKTQWQGYSSLLIGPGLGNTPETKRFLQQFFIPKDRKRRTGFTVSDVEKTAELDIIPPLIIDADGLNILAQTPNWYRFLPPNTILTPHPGEMARLTGSPVTDINRDRYSFARKWAKTWGHIVLLKGANTIIAQPEGTAIVLPFSNPGLATAGSGDVLAGVIAAMLAQGLSPFHAAVSGAYLHGIAGEICRRDIGTAGMIAGDVALFVAKALQQFE